jgi:hypothetical protein
VRGHDLDRLVEIERMPDPDNNPIAGPLNRRQFPDTGPDTALDLVDSRATPKGVTIQVYRPTGRPQYAMATTD